MVSYEPATRTLTVGSREISLNEVLRLTIIIGAYLLFRPYFLKLTKKFQERDHSRAFDPDGDEASSGMATGVVRGAGGVGDDGEDVDDDSWGARARRRKREEMARAKALIEEAERERAEEEDDKDIAEFLVD